MVDYQQTSLWKKTLEMQTEIDNYKDQRDWLREGYKRLRQNTKILAGEIATVLPEYTVHDINHIDALWDMASLLLPDNIEVNPAEAFVLGGSILLHDLGMALAAYPDGIVKLKQELVWQDTVAALKHEYQVKNSIQDGVIIDEIERKATEKTLRMLHARRAAELVNVSWKNSIGQDMFLIEDPELRLSYGRIIGLIAQSHWLRADELEKKLPPILGALSVFPPDWTVDSLKLACILRLADAIQIDDRRAPTFLRPLRALSTLSEAHWNFQEKLYSPHIENNKLIFTSKTSFTVNEIDSWWVGFDTLKMIDNELHLVDTIMVSKYQKSFLATSVMFIEDAAKLSRLLTVDGWEPVDVKIQVNNVAKLATTIGGKQLYGDNPRVPLRELIQNASDAIRARRLIDNLDNNYGQILIKLDKDDEGHFIEVEDDGIGMSQKVLTGPLLDFGQSFWGSELMHDEFPGLETKGYLSTGKYGIGFFSLFMWGEKVHVVTNRYENSRNSTIVLEFNHGAGARPILRRAKSTEYINNGGTRVKVWMNRNVIEALLNSQNQYKYGHKKNKKLTEVIEKLCPSIDCNISVRENNKTINVIRANDWKTMTTDMFLKRLLYKEDYVQLKNKNSDIYLQLKNSMSIIRNDAGEVIGRTAIIPTCNNLFETSDLISNLRGFVTVGGFATTRLRGILGILIGYSPTAARNVGIPLANLNEINLWLTLQAEKLEKHSIDAEIQVEIASIYRSISKVKNTLKICKHKTGYMNFDEVTQYVKENKSEQYILISDTRLELWQKDTKSNIQINENVFSADSGIPNLLQTPPETRNEFYWPINRDYTHFHNYTLKGLVIEAIAKGWGIDVDDLYHKSSFSDDDISFTEQIGTKNDEPLVNDFVDIIKK